MVGKGAAGGIGSRADVSACPPGFVLSHKGKEI
jgi:hypothetical protein